MRRDLSRPSRSKRPEPPAVALAATSMTDLLQVVPYLLGFHPAASAVAVLLHRGRVLLTARSDLGPSVVALSRQLGPVGRAHRVDGVVLVVYTDSPRVARETVEALLATAELPHVVDAVHVDADYVDPVHGHGARWWSLLHDGDPDGCPLDAGSLAAEAVYAGLTAVPDRADAVAAAERPRPERLAELEEPTIQQLVEVASLSPSARVSQTVELVGRWLEQSPAGHADPPVLSAVELIRLGLLVSQLDARDAAMLLLAEDNADSLLGCWSAVVSVTSERYQPGPLCLLGLAAWVAGSGALLVRCIERVEECDPDYSLARLLARIADEAVPPSAWTGLTRGLAPPKTPARDPRPPTGQPVGGEPGRRIGGRGRPTH